MICFIYNGRGNYKLNDDLTIGKIYSSTDAVWFSDDAGGKRFLRDFKCFITEVQPFKEYYKSCVEPCLVR